MKTCVVQIFGAMGQMKEDLTAMAKHYSEKYNEANEVLKLRSEEKSTLVKDKKNWKEPRMVSNSMCRS